MAAVALWRRLDTPGHDAARLVQTEAGWALRGTAVFLHNSAPACLNYTLELDSGWATVMARIKGFLGETPADQTIRRDRDGWLLNDQRVEGLSHLVDLDLGFTPATNLQHLRRVGMKVGEEAEIPVAWLNAGANMLVELQQIYERREGRTYWYRAPGVGYEALLEMAENGFVELYPGLWQMETR